MKKLITILFFIFFLPSSLLLSQISVTNEAPYNNGEYLVNNVLFENDLTVSNISSYGLNDGIGYFDGSSCNIGLENGIVLSTGGLELVANGVDGSGSLINSESDLEMLMNLSVYNVVGLEFDFVAVSNSISFNYVFGSKEYSLYTCSQFNDVFGVFISGPGINGVYSNDAVNIAHVPDPEGAANYQDWQAINTGIYTYTPICVNSINSGINGSNPSWCDVTDFNWQDYNIYWIDNDYFGDSWEGVNLPPAPINSVQGLTGFTVPLTTRPQSLIVGETYKVKFVIADVYSAAFNSAVFIEPQSFNENIECVDNNNLLSPLDCEQAVSFFGCGDSPYGDLSEICPITCDNCIIYGCSDSIACNYDPTVNTDNGSCVYAEEGFDCDGNCLSDTITVTIVDTVYIDNFITDTIVETEYVEVIITEYIDCDSGLPCTSGMGEIIDKSKTDGKIYNLLGQEVFRRDGIYIEGGEIKYRF